MSPAALALVLTAALLHVVWNGEPHRATRLIGAVCIAGGVGALALG